MDFKLQRLDSGEKIAAGSAAALFVCMFFGWFNFGFNTENAWESLHLISPVLTVAIAATLGIAFMKALEKSLGDIPTGATIFVLGSLATVLVFFRLLDPVSLAGAEGFQANGSVEAGLFLGLFAAAGIAIGGYLASGGTALDQLKALLPNERSASAPPQATPSPPPPPPQAAAPAEAAPVKAAAFCEACGTALAAEDRFCSECGKQRAT